MKSCHSFRFVFCIDIQIDFGRFLRKQIFSEALFLTDLVWEALDATFDGVLSCLIKRVLPKVRSKNVRYTNRNMSLVDFLKLHPAMC